MDNTSQDFARKILGAIEHIAKLLTQDNKEPKSENSKSPEQEPIPQPPVGGKPYPIPTVTTTHTARDQDKEFREKWKFRVEIDGAIILLVYTAFTGLTLIEIKMSNQISRDSFEASQRAYIAVGIIEAHLDSAVPWIKIPIRNYGHIPSRYVLLEGDVVKEIFRSASPIAWRIKLGGDYSEFASGFPGSTRDEQGGFDLDLSGFLSPEDIRRIDNAQERIVIGATVTYKTGFRNDTDKFGFCAAYNPGSQEPLIKWDNCGVITPEFSKQMDEAKRKGLPLPRPPSYWPSARPPMPKQNEP